MFTLKDNEALQALKKQLGEARKAEKGTLKTTAKGFGFVSIEGSRDVFVPKHLMTGLLPESTLLVYTEKNDKGESVTEIKSVLDRGNLEYFCKIEVFSIEDRQYVNARPLRGDLDIKIKLGQNKHLNVSQGDIVLVEIKPESRELTPHFKGKILSAYGNEKDPSTIWRLIKAEYNLNDALDELPVKEPLALQSKEQWLSKSYEDWTHLPLVTIDSYSANDLDDALYVMDSGDYWLLHIAIANPTSILEDDESLRALLVSRGVTHYLANEIVHLMVKSYSEDYFSLLEGKVRSALGAAIPVHKLTGELGKAVFNMVVIESVAKLSYDDVAEHIKQRHVDVIDSNPVVAESLNNLHEMSKVRLEWRRENCFVGIDDPEFYFVLEDSRPVAVREVKKKVSHSMVEEAAIAANIAFTQWAEERSLPIIYVTHGGFDPQREKNLKEYLSARNVPFSDTDTLIEVFMSSHEYFAENLALLEESGTKYEIELAKSCLRDLRAYYKKGELSLTKEPHLPMGIPAYATWTSPIRKSVDMENHLSAKAYLLGLSVNPPSEDDVMSIQTKNRNSRQAERRLNRLLGLTYLDTIKTDVVKAKLTSVMKKAVRVTLVDTDITITLGLRDLAYDGFITFDPVNQLVLVGDEEAAILGDVLELNVKDVSVYDGLVIAEQVVNAPAPQVYS
jgi:exoribonuclease-2